MQVWIILITITFSNSIKGNYFSGEKHSSYLGCYENVRTSVETLYSLPMTIPLCRRHCVSYGYGLAVLYTDHCRCVYDDSYLLPYNVTYDGNCNHACPGDASTKCGGDGSTDVYMSVYEAYELPGCYPDEYIKDQYTTVTFSDFKMTSTFCKEYCRGRNSTYAAVKMTLCQCMDDQFDAEGFDGPLSASWCFEPCPGSHSETCGETTYFSVSNLRMNSSIFLTCDDLYNSALTYPGTYYTLYTGTPTTCSFTENIFHIGCYKASHVVVEAKVSSIRQCRDVCQQAGMIFAAVFSGTDCECFDEWDSHFMTPATSCNVVCAEGEPSYCGGSQGKSVYYALGGCYQTDISGMLSDMSSFVNDNFEDSSMSAVLCRELCRERGYNITLLQATSCTCMNESVTMLTTIKSSKSASSVPDKTVITTNTFVETSVLWLNPGGSSCNVECPAGNGEFCGQEPEYIIIQNLNSGPGYYDTCDELYDAGAMKIGDYIIGGWSQRCNFWDKESDYMCASIDTTLPMSTLSTDHVTDCRIFCSSYNYTYAAVNDSICMCSNNNGDFRDTFEPCNYRCSGDARAYCGGFGAFSVYYTTGGCYLKSSADTSFPSNVTFQFNAMTQTKCKAICRALGHTFMMISGTKCACSDSSSLTIGYGPSVSGDECSIACQGDASEYCGSSDNMIVKNVKADTCPDLGTLTNANTNTSSQTIGDVVTLSCIPTVSEFPDESVDMVTTCINVDGVQYPQWIPEPQYCLMIPYCPLITSLSNATLSTTSRYLSAVVHLACGALHTFPDRTTDMTVVCGEDQTWYPAPENCLLPPKCSPLDVAQNVTTNTSERWAGTYVNIACPDRMFLRNSEQSDVLFCDWDNGWMPPPSNCSYSVSTPPKVRSTSLYNVHSYNENGVCRQIYIGQECRMGVHYEMELDLEVLANGYQTPRTNHDKTVRGMEDPDWLEIVGHPTIPHVQSLREPPASVALHPRKERLIGITNRAASKRYLDRLQREREKNQEVLMECVGNLPLTIKQMVYPEKPLTKEAWRLGGKKDRGKFRLGSRDASNYWQENLEHWEKEEYSPEPTPRQSPGKHSSQSHNGGSGKRTGSRYSESIESVTNIIAKGEFIHHPGFQGSEPAKLKVGKKTSKYSSKSDSAANDQSTFRPKGFGSLYDEMEFQRRYKKVFDVNNHIHFVHSNYLSGHKIAKRSKLPPIGYVPGLHAESQENLDIFAIMSVQNYNHPEGEGPHATTTTPGSQSSPRRGYESSGGIEVPPGFIPSPVKSYSYSPFNGIKGSPPHNISPRGTHKYMYRLPSLSQGDPDSTTAQHSNDDIGQSNGATDGYTPLTDRSYRGKKSKKSKHHDNSKFKRDLNKKKKLKNETDHTVTDDTDNLTDDMEPFTFSVKVKIKPRKHSYRGKDTGETDESDDENTKDIKVYVTNSMNDTRKDRIIYPSHNNELNNKTCPTDEERVLKPNNISVLTNEYGIVSKRVQYPEKFVVDNSLAEVDESKVSVSETDLLKVPSTPDSNKAPFKGDERNDSNLSSGHSIPQIRTICPTPEQGKRDIST